MNGGMVIWRLAQRIRKPQAPCFIPYKNVKMLGQGHDFRTYLSVESNKLLIRAISLMSIMSSQKDTKSMCCRHSVKTLINF